jgi:osmotically-inducible protein OsmY
MPVAILTDGDKHLRDAVVRQLDLDPGVDASAIGVSAREAVVTLTGYARTYLEKLAAERTAKSVYGVRAVANDLQVRLIHQSTDSDLALNVVHALGRRSSVPENVQAGIHNGYVTLTGVVNWLYQKQDAESAARHVQGVRGVFNEIVVKARSTAKDIRHRIVAALHRTTDVEARHVTVTVDGSLATLTGRVGSFMQFEAATRAAANAPGIARVDNHLEIRSEDA